MPAGSVASQPTPSVNGSPYTGADVTYTETSSGVTAAGNKIVLISPYATQIAAYRTTFTAVPTVSTPSNGMVLGTPTVNNSAQVVPTANGLITAPAQTVVTIPVVTASSTGPSSSTISGIGYKPGSFVPPGAFVLTGTVQQNNSAVGGGQVVDLVNTYNLGTTSATTPPNASFTQTPSALTNLDYATFAFASDQGDTTFACALDGHVISLRCSSPNTVAGLASGSHTFTVEAFNASGYSSGPLSYTWTIDSTAPSATVAIPTTVSAPVTVSFNEPVNHISATTMTLSVVEAGTTTPSALGYTLSCISGNSAPEPCLASSTYTKVQVEPDANLIPGQHYVLELNPAGVSPQIGDEAGNPVASITQNSRGPLTVDETDTGTVPAWRKVSAKSASGGSYAVAHLPGETANFSFTGPSVTWQTATGPTQGKAKVYVDGALKTTVNNYASSMQYGIARTVSGLTDGSHTLKVVTSGVKGSRAGTDTQVIVDAFIVGGVKTEQTDATYTWRQIAASSATGGTYATEDTAGATYSMTFRGTAITWRTLTGPTMGKASIYIDGVLKTTYNNYAANSRYKDLTIANLSDDIHTIKIVVLGQHRNRQQHRHRPISRHISTGLPRIRQATSHPPNALGHLASTLNRSGL